MLLLTALTQRLNALGQSADPQPELNGLLPQLRTLAGDVAIVEKTRINLLTRATRLLDPTAPRIDDPALAFEALERALVEAERASCCPEPTPIRDNGPFHSRDQALAQFGASTFGIPGWENPGPELSTLVLAEALMISGAKDTPYEAEIRKTIAEQLDPAAVQVIAGWLIRASYLKRQEG